MTQEKKMELIFKFTIPLRKKQFDAKIVNIGVF